MNKEELYNRSYKQIVALAENESNVVGVLANVSAVLKEAFPYYLWVGFYIVKNNHLQLGPFQGSVACYSISFGKGVCGSAWQQKQTLIVNDVNTFPGHIACSSLSRSEIVVPIFKDHNVIAVIDVDSCQLSAFDKEDQRGLENIAKALSQVF